MAIQGLQDRQGRAALARQAREEPQDPAALWDLQERMANQVRQGLAVQDRRALKVPPGQMVRMGQTEPTAQTELTALTAQPDPAAPPDQRVLAVRQGLVHAQAILIQRHSSSRIALPLL